MNITPNSFSDGGLHQCKEQIQATLKMFNHFDVDILDVGAESTAPMNASLSMEEEWQRLSDFIKVLKASSWTNVISLDTYKPEIALKFFTELRNLGFNDDRFIWNDVSGIWDDSVETFLESFSKSRYVFCHNESPERTLTGRHMDYVVKESEDIVAYLKEFFNKAALKKHGERVILDPCFGFSKTYEQNIDLIRRFDELQSSSLGHQWVFGISKKSFLRRFWQQNYGDDSLENLLQKSEFLHLLSVRNICHSAQTSLGKGVVFRVHNPEIVHLACQDFPNN
ncbi:MAG: dihydropteroate synthase [Bacteriovoracaceae bacterium]|nr:dihydropteroate synthase [Bacteriovoracaceae bacterium]